MNNRRVKPFVCLLLAVSLLLAVLFAGAMLSSCSNTSPHAETSANPAGEEQDMLDPHNYSIELRYSSDIAHGGEAASTVLTNAGYTVTEDVDSHVYQYSKSLIVYRSTDNIAMAQDIQQRLGFGRIVENSGRFIFSGDFLVIYVDDLAGGDVAEEDCLSYVAIRNGWDPSKGFAKEIAQELAAQNYQITEIGTTDTLIYRDTMVIYREEEDLEAAETIKDTIGCGTTIPALGRWDFEGDILIIVGEDYAGP